MKTQQERKSRKDIGLKNRILILLFIPILIIICLFFTSVKSNETNKGTSKFSTLDTLALFYDHIDASNFPRIVSLVTVMDRAGFNIFQLDENNFMVFEDNTRELPIEVIELPSADVGINVVLTIDRSSSMGGQPIEDEKTAAIAFIDLMQSKDKSAIVTFARAPRTEYPFSNNKDSLKISISNITVGSSTAIFDALIHSVNLMSEELKNRAIILMTDAGDNVSSHTPEDAITACKTHEVRVFTIGLGIPLNGKDENILTKIANETGGLYYYSPTSQDLEEIYKTISKLLHHRYQISYRTHNPVKDGTLRHVRIDVLKNTATSSDTASYRAPYEPNPENPVFEVIPNPFTPNDDGFNDWTEFRNSDGIQQGWSISIMDRAGNLIRHLSNGETFWDGKNKSGQLMLPGCYLYIIYKSNQIIQRGLIQLIR